MAEYKHYLEEINRQVLEDPDEFISSCEHRYSNQIRTYVREVIKKESDNKIIMLAGPSSSGKTTSANKMARLISRMGYNAYVISLDDFYKNREEIPVGPDGKQDFETVYALELPILTECLRGLAENGEADLPHFDFDSGKRTDAVIHLTLEKGDIVVVEGLHALNPIITDCLPAESLTKMYVSAATDIYKNSDEMFFSKREIRFVRRMMRDYQFRGSSVENTYNMWPKVLAGEVSYLGPYKGNADFVLDSVHGYELCIYKDIVVPLLQDLPQTHEGYKNAVSIIRRLQEFESLEKSRMPKSSLLREFVGK